MSDDYKVVTADIPFGSVYAYRRGDKILAQAVEENDWHDYVAGPNTKEARKAQGLEEDDPVETAAASGTTSPGTPPQNTSTTPAAGGKDK